MTPVVYPTRGGTTVLQLVLYIAAAILLGLATFGVTGRINTLAAGLLCWLLAAAIVPALG